MSSRWNLQRQFREKCHYPFWGFTILQKLLPHLLKYWEIILISQDFYVMCLFLERLISTEVNPSVMPGIIIIIITLKFGQWTLVCKYNRYAQSYVHMKVILFILIYSSANKMYAIGYDETGTVLEIIIWNLKSSQCLPSKRLTPSGNR